MSNNISQGSTTIPTSKYESKLPLANYHQPQRPTRSQNELHWGTRRHQKQHQAKWAGNNHNDWQRAWMRNKKPQWYIMTYNETN